MHWNEVVGGTDNRKRRVAGLAVIAACLALACMPIAARAVESARRETIAVVDTCDQGGIDDNGHGSDMVQAILAEDPSANVITVKALGDDGSGSGSDAARGIREAVGRGAKVIDLSAAGRLSGDELTALNDAITWAKGRGATVYMAAGNFGLDDDGLGVSADAVRVGALGDNGGIHSTSDAGSSVDGYVKADSTSRAAAIAAARAAEGRDPFDKGTAVRVARAARVGIPDDGRLHAQAGNISDWCIADVAGTHHWVFYCNISDNSSPTMHVRTYVGTKKVNLDVKPSKGSWTRHGRTFTRAYIVDNATMANSADIRIQINGYFMKISGGRYDIGEYEVGFPNTSPDKKITLTIDGNGGTTKTTSLTMRVGESDYKTCNVNASRTGYDYKGLYTAASGGVQVWNASGSATAAAGSYWVYNNTHNVFYWKWDVPTTVYAQWTPHTYTIDCEGNPSSGESTLLSPASKTLSATYDSAVTLPSASDFTYKGHTLTGWNTAANGSGTNYAPGATVKNLTSEQGATVKLYAQWRVTPFTVAIYPNGGRTPNGNTNQQTISATNGFCYVGICTRSNYDFAGYKVEGVTGSASSLTSKDYGTFTYGNFYNKTRDYLSNYLLTAQWNPWTETIRYDGNGATGGSTADSNFTYSDNGTYNLRACGFTKTGYSFVGWSTTTDSSGLITDYSKWLASKNGETVTVHAIWKQTTFTITYNANGGSGAPAAQSFTFNNGESVSATKPTRTGYDFVGWNTKADGSGTAIAAGGKIPTGTQNVTLYAQWKAHTYYVKFDGSGSTGGSMSTVTATYGKVAQLLANAYTKAGYTFAGWATSKGGAIAYGDKASFTNLTATQGATVTLYATWSTNGSTKYTVNHWQEQLDGSYKVTDTQTLYSAWGSSVTPTPLSYTGFSSPAAKTVTVAKDGSTTVDYRYTRNSYGLTVSGILDGRAVASLPAGCTVDVYSNGAKVASGVTSWRGTVKYGAKFEVKVTATASGYARHADHDGGTASGTMGTSGASYAPALATTYRISYALNGGSVSGQPTTYDYYTSRTIPAATRDGYAFAGWTGSNGTTPQKAVTIPTGQTGDKSYTANWTANTYKVTYDANGGSGAPAAQPFAYNGGAKLSTATPTRTGYAFTGWNTKANGSGTALAAGAQIPTGTKDLTLYAQWRANSYTITYDANGGSGAPAAQSFTYGSGAKLSQTKPTQAGKSFTGWNTKKDGSGTAVAAGAAIPATWQDTTLYAQWATAPTVDAVTMVQDGTDGWWAYAKVTDHGTGLKKVSFPTWTEANGQDDIQSGWADASSTSAAGTAGSWTVGGTTYNWRYHVLVSDHKGEYGRYNTHVYAYDRLGGYGVRANASYIMTFTVSYDLGGGSASGNPVTYTSESAAFTLKNPTWEGHTFDGWTGTGLSSATASVTVPSGSHGNRSYKANWTTKTAYLDLNGSFEGAASGALVHATADVSTDGGKTWSTGVADFYSPLYYGTKVVIRNVRAEAGYTLTGVTVTGGAKGLSHDASAGTWSFTTSDTQTNVVGATRANTYTVKFDRNSSSATGSIADVSAKYGTGYTAPSSGMSWAGRKLVSWNTKADGSGTKIELGGSYKNLTTADGGTVTLYAQWATISYTIKYADPLNTSWSNSTKVAGGETVTIGGQSISHTGKTLTGWNTKADGSGTGYKEGQKVTNLTNTDGATVTLYAQWANWKYTIHFDGNGAAGGSMADQSMTYGTAAKLNANAFKPVTGSRFVGWKDAATGKTYADGQSVNNLATKDGQVITLTAQWTPITYKVHFDGNGSTSGSMSDQSMTYGSAANLTGNAFSKTNYVFTGWNTATDGSGTAYGDKASVKNLTATQGATITLHAQWRRGTYTINYKYANGSAISSQKANLGDAVSLAASPALTGYTFTNWNTKADGTGTSYKAGQQVTNLCPKDGDAITLYLQSTPWTAKVHFDGNGSDGGSMSDQTLTWAKAVNLTKNGLTRTGHTFTGWNTKKDGSGTGYADAASYTWKDASVGNGGTITLYAQWKVNTYTNHINHWVTSLKGKEGNNNAKDAYKLTSTSWTQQYGSSLALDTSRGTKVPNGTKLVHAGSSDFAGKWVTYTIPATVTQPAKDTWTDYYYDPTNYTITYDLGGGTNDSANPSTYNVLYGVTLKDPTRKGYEFAGWYDKATRKRVTGINEGANATFTSADDLYAKLAARTTGNVELEARWKTKYVDVTFHRNTSSTDATTTTVRYSYDDWAAGKALAFSSQGWTRTGYTQLGWSNSDSDTAADYSVTNGVNGDWILERSPKTDLYAVWKAWGYKVHFDGNGAASGSMADQSLTWDKDASLTANGFTAPTGMRFVGWNTKADGSGTAYADKASIKNVATKDGDTITLYAQWRYVTYKVHFDGNGSTSGSMADQSMTYATAANLTGNAFSRSHYVFTGWNTKADGTGTAYADKASVKNLSTKEGATVTLYAQWRKAVYTIRYVDQAGNTISTQRANAGESVTIADYTKPITGASFTGWNTAKDGSGTAYKANASVPALSDADGATVTLWLQTRAWTMRVHFDGNGSTSGGMSDQTLTWAKAATLNGNGFIRAGYTFTGWNTKADGSGTGFANGASYTWADTTVAKDGGSITLYAQWTPKSYAINYLANGGSGTMASSSIKEDGQATLNENGFNRVGYTFTGWNTKADGSGISYSNGETVMNVTGQMLGRSVSDMSGWSGVTANATGATGALPVGTSAYGLLTGRDGIYQGVSFADGTTYKVSGWMQPASGAQVPARVGVSYVGASNQRTWVGSPQVAADAKGWSYRTYTFTKGSSMSSMYLWLQSEGWPSTSPSYDGSNEAGHWYFAGLSLRDMSVTSTNLYAQWRAHAYTVRFDGNGSDGGSTASMDMRYGETKSLTANGFTRVGYTFTGWNTKADGSGTAYADKATIKNLTAADGATITLYAQWKVNTYTDTIAHWMFGLQHGEGNNGTDKTAYLLGATSWRQDFGTQVTYDATRQTKVPNGTYLSTTIGSPSFDGSWKSYTMPKTVTQPARDTYVEYYYSPITYKITYDLGGGTNDASNPATYNVLYGVTLKNPTRKGYEFAGWYDKATGKRVTGINEGANATFTSADDLYAKLATRSTGNVELEARWKTKYVDVTFHRNTSATDATTSTVRYSYDDWAAGKAPAFSSQGWTRTGYTQLGWSADASDTAADYSVTNGVNGDWILEKSPKTDLYAVWKINQYSVDVNVLIDDKVRNNSGAWDGKNLGSWGDKKLVTFDTYVNGSKVGTGDNDFYKMLDYGSKVELKNIKPAEGFEFNPGWATSETVPAYNTELIIRLNQTAYKISYDLAGGTFGTQAAPTTYHIGDAPVTIPTPTRDHHVFLGWTGSNGTTPQASVTIPTGSTGDRSFTANWRNDRYTIKFDKNSADASGSIADLACEWGKDYKMPDGSAYSRTGWHVTSWNTKADGTGKVVALGATTRNLASGDGATVTLYAQWAPNAYAIAYDGNGATAGSMAPTAATYGTDVKLSANAFSRSGYEFAGWATSATGGTEQLSAAEQGGTLTGEIAASATAKATGAPDWAPTGWGGYAKLATAAGPQAVSPNARWAAGSSGRLTLWAAPEGTGAIEVALELHLADGSVAYADAATTQLAASSWRRVTLDATVPTTWEGKAVSYAQPAVRATGGAAYVTGLSSKQGVRYADGATVRDLTSERDATVTLHAQWEPRVATVSFDGNGGTGTMASRSLLSTEAGAKAPECAFERRGYEFTGWNTKKDGSGVAVAAGNAVTYASLGKADRVTLYAQWQTKAYTLKFEPGYGASFQNEADSSRSVRYLSQVGTLPTVTRDGSTFIGWFDASGKQWGATTTMPIPDDGESITLTAKWGFDASNLPDHLINGDFDFYPNGSARVNGKGVYINPKNHTWMDIGTYLNTIANYERSTGKVPTGKTLAGLFDSSLWHDWGGYFTMWNGTTGFGWLSYQKGDLYDRAQVPSGIQVTYLRNNGLNYAEIDAHTVGTLYQDVATTPGAIMHMELDHASVTGMFEAMTVLVGDSSNPAIQNNNVDLAQFSPATLTSAQFGFTRPNFRRVDSGATNYGTTPAGTQTILFNLKVPPIDPKTGRQESGYLGYVGNTITANKNTGWTRWEGFYRVPAGQTATRFTFKTLAFGTNQQQGNLIKHVRFEQWYPLWYDANDFDAASGGTVSGDLPTPTVSEQDAKSYLYYGAGTQVDANTACYLNTVTNKAWDPTKLHKTDASGEELTFLGWSDVPITHAVTTKAEYEDAETHIKAASKYKVAKTTVDNRVYAVWARQPRVTFDLNYHGAPDGMLSPDAKGKDATDAVATQTIAGVFTQAGVKDKVATDPADIDGSWSTTQGVGGSWDGKVTGVRSGWKFQGWFTSPGCEDGTRYDFSTPVTRDVTLYAKWARGMSLTYDYATDSAIRDGDTVALSGGGTREVANDLPRTVTGSEYWDGNTVSAITVPAYRDAVITRTLPGGTKRQYQVSLVPTGWGYDRVRAILDGDSTTKADVGGGTDCSKSESIRLDLARTGGTGNLIVYVRYDPTVVDGVTTFAK